LLVLPTPSGVRQARLGFFCNRGLWGTTSSTAARFRRLRRFCRRKGIRKFGHDPDGRTPGRPGYGIRREEKTTLGGDLRPWDSSRRRARAMSAIRGSLAKRARRPTVKSGGRAWGDYRLLRAGARILHFDIGDWGPSRFRAPALRFFFLYKVREEEEAALVARHRTTTPATWRTGARPVKGRLTLSGGRRPTVAVTSVQRGMWAGCSEQQRPSEGGTNVHQPRRWGWAGPGTRSVTKFGQRGRV